MTEELDAKTASKPEAAGCIRVKGSKQYRYRPSQK